MTEALTKADLTATRADLERAMKKTKNHLVVSQIIISGVLILALKLIH